MRLVGIVAAGLAAAGLPACTLHFGGAQRMLCLRFLALPEAPHATSNLMRVSAASLESAPHAVLAPRWSQEHENEVHVICHVAGTVRLILDRDQISFEQVPERPAIGAPRDVAEEVPVLRDLIVDDRHCHPLWWNGRSSAHPLGKVVTGPGLRTDLGTWFYRGTWTVEEFPSKENGYRARLLLDTTGVPEGEGWFLFDFGRKVLDAEVSGMTKRSSGDVRSAWTIPLFSVVFDGETWG